MTRAAEPNPNAGPPPAAELPPGAWRVLLWAALLPPALTTLLALLNTPLGCPGRFTYLYSPVPGLRMIAAGFAAVLAAALGLGIWLIAARDTHRRALGWVAVLFSGAGLMAWTYLAPPAHLNQHLFNSQSPSQDGAFVRESKTVSNLREYLAAFPDRARKPPEEMRGTRVISNPPATTVLAWTIRQTVARWPALGRWASKPLQTAISSDPRYTSLQDDIETGVLFLLSLWGLWALSGLALFGAARTLLPTRTALAFAAMCVFSPSGLLFTPGKDTAQLLTTGVALWLWLVAWRRSSYLAAGGAGLWLVLTTLVSLVHIWLAAIVLVATVAEALKERRMRVVWLTLLAAAAGSCVSIAGLRLAGCDWATTLRAAAAAQAQITRGPDAMPFYWQALGVLLFALFAGAGLYVLIHVSARTTPASGPQRFAMGLVLGSALVMLVTVGFTNIETPRLWIPFVPLIMLGLMLRASVVLDASRRAALLLGVLVFAHIASGALQWTRMDMREAENRIASERFFR